MNWSWSWTKVYQVVESYKPRLKSIMVRWIRPKADKWKLNMNDNFISFIGKAWIGGVFRTGNGQMVLAFAHQFICNLTTTQKLRQPCRVYLMVL